MRAAVDVTYMQRLARVALWIAFMLSTAWFLLMTAGALLMSTGLGDEPGDTNGFMRFLRFFALGLSGLAGLLLSGWWLRGDNASAPSRGFDTAARRSEPDKS